MFQTRLVSWFTRTPLFVDGRLWLLWRQSGPAVGVPS
jgi:hypothetical protein